MSLKYWPKITSESNISMQNDSAIQSFQPAKVQVRTLLISKFGPYLILKWECRNNNINNNSDNPLTYRRTDGSKNENELV